MSRSSGFSYQALAVSPGVLFVATDEPLLVFPSLSAAKSSLEAADVVAGIYLAAYGPNGEPYRVGCKGNRVLIERTGEADKADEIKALLLRYLEACEDPADATQSLDELVAIAWSIERDFWLRNKPDSEGFGTRIPIWSGMALVVGLGALWYFGFR